MAETVTLSGVSKRFDAHHGGTEVLNDVQIEVEAGEFVAILGPSGCGKSTLLRLMAGLERPSGGDVRLGSRPVSGVDARCAVVFQEPRLFPWKTIGANVAIGARRHRGAADTTELLERVGLTGFDRAYPHQLSGGMAQRAALARGLAGRPDVLLLDEPFAALDALTRMEMQDLLIDVCQVARPTVLMVTHDVDEALYLADRVIVLGARPATVIAEVRVPLSRPRDRSDAAFSGPRATLLERVGVTHPTVSGPRENVRLSA
ncbi:MAG: ABC transporter ATP-binding protein [Thermomicrobiales bacterium]